MNLSTENTSASNTGVAPELTEEAKLRAKYGGALPRQQNMLTKKLISKPKYFDSGDYNVAKAQGKLAASKPDPSAKINSNKEVPPPPIVPETVTGHEIPTPETLMPRKLSCTLSMTPTSSSMMMMHHNTPSSSSST